MTTKNSPTSVLRNQADRIANSLKRAERGEWIGGGFDAKIVEARSRPGFKAGIVMDDKVIVVEMPWSVIRDTSEAGLSEYILDQMRESQETVQ